jgi:hypothetical protein
MAIAGAAVVVAAGDAGTNSVADGLGIKPDMVVQEIGWDEDVDDDVRAVLEGAHAADVLLVAQRYLRHRRSA